MKPKYHLQFTEEMKGYFGFGVDDYRAGWERGRANHWPIMFHLTIATDDTYAFIADRNHHATAGGWVYSDPLGGKLKIESGRFNLFVEVDPVDGFPCRHMLYRLWFADKSGHPLTLAGFKDIHHNPVSGVWSETTTLYTKIFAGHVEPEGDGAAYIVGAGIINILAVDFARQCTTFRVSGPGLTGRLHALAAFGQLFAGQLWKVFRPRSLQQA